MPQNNSYNKVYESLVRDEKDIVGMLAYAMYKKQKQETIKDFKLNHSGQQPKPSDLDSFHKLALQQTQLNVYRQQAADLTSLLANEILKNKQNDIKELVDRHIEKPKGFWYGIFQNLLANVIWLIVLAIIAIILWSQDHGPLETVKAIITSSEKSYKPTQ